MNRKLLTALVLVLGPITACKKSDTGITGRVAELEKRANAAEARAAEAELQAAEATAARETALRQLEEQKLAAERDAIERERTLIEERRAELDRLHAERGEAAAEELRMREEALAGRERTMDQLQSTLGDKAQSLEEQQAQLHERDRALAGREALPGPQNGQTSADFHVTGVNVFYDPLSAYGSWFDSPDYGYVWRPSAYRNAGWRPYTRGRWACTDRGWMWISDEPFGWATYHYGRWALCRDTGWIWVPGTEWAPSWVCWRHGGSYTGWAPLPPETMAYRGHRWGSSVEATFGIGSLWFSFVETRHFGFPIHTHCLPAARNAACWGNTVNITNIHVVNNRVICGGPSYGDVAHQTSRRPPFYRIEEDRSGRIPRSTGPGNHRIRDGRVVVSQPGQGESRNPDALRPPRVIGRLDKIDVERNQPIDPDIVREFQKNRPGPTRRDEERPIRDPGGEKPAQPDATRGEEQRRLNQLAEDQQNDLRNRVDDRLRVLPRPAGNPPQDGPARPPVSPENQRTDPRGEDQRKQNEHAEALQEELRNNVDDRIRVLPRATNRSASPPQANEHPGPHPTSPAGSDIQPPQRRLQDRPEEPRVLPRREDAPALTRERELQAEESRRRQQQNTEELGRQQQRQAVEMQRRQQQALEESRRQQAAEQARAQQQRQAAETQRRQQQQAAEESRRQQQRQSEETQRRQSEEAQRRPARR